MLRFRGLYAGAQIDRCRVSNYWANYVNMQADTWIVGTWMLQSFITRLDDGSKHLPYGDKPEGRIVYTPDGFMSAHLWNPESHIEGANQNADPHYFSYCGDWTIEGMMVRHRVHAATEASWTGQDKLRTLKSTGNLLELTAQQVFFRGKYGLGVLVWDRRRT